MSITISKTGQLQTLACGKPWVSDLSDDDKDKIRAGRIVVVQDHKAGYRIVRRVLRKDGLEYFTVSKSHPISEII